MGFRINFLYRSFWENRKWRRDSPKVIDFLAANPAVDFPMELVVYFPRLRRSARFMLMIEDDQMPAPAHPCLSMTGQGWDFGDGSPPHFEVPQEPAPIAATYPTENTDE
jgi:hypothetical protein